MCNLRTDLKRNMELGTEFPSMDAADIAIRRHSAKQNRNVHVTAHNYDQLKVKRYYCESLSKRNGNGGKVKRYCVGPLCPPKSTETEEQRIEREEHCKFWIVVREREGESARIVSKEDRKKHTCEARMEVVSRKRTSALTSKNLVLDPNLRNILKKNKFKLNVGIFRSACAPRNELNQPVYLNDRMVSRAVRFALRRLLGYYKEDVAYIESVSRRLNEAGYKCEVLKGNVNGRDTYERFLYTPPWAIKAENHWRPHIYSDMYHVLNNVGGCLGGITTLDADDGMVVLAIIHFQVLEYRKLCETIQFIQDALRTPLCSAWVSRVWRW